MYIIFFTDQTKGDNFTHFLHFVVLRWGWLREYIAVELVQPTVSYFWRILHVQFQHRISCFASLELPTPERANEK